MDKEFNKGSGDGSKEIFDLHPSLATSLDRDFNKPGGSKRVPVEGRNHDLGHGDVVIAAITSCTNTSNPSVMVAAGLLAARRSPRASRSKPWVKTSLAPGSQVVAEYLEKSGLQKDLDTLGFNLVGFGCTTCIGNSGPLPEEISEAINKNDLVAAAVLSGNRNFEGRVNADVRANYLASPPLVVAYAIAGSMYVDVAKQPLGLDKKGKKVFLKDIWPTSREIDAVIRKCITKQVFAEEIRQRVQGRRGLAQDRGQGRPDLRLGRPFDLRAEPALLRGHGEDASIRSRTSSMRASSACSSTRSRPTTSRRPDRSRRRARPANICATTRCARRTSTSTARGAAITR